MTSFKKKFAGFIRQLSNPGITMDNGDDEPKSPTSGGSFIQRYLNGEVKRVQPPIYHSKSCQELPVKKLALLKTPVFAAYTGPQGGLTSVNRNPRNGDILNDGMEYLNEELLGRRQARLAQPEDLDEFIDVVRHQPNHNHICATTPPQSRRPSTISTRKTSIEEDYNLVQEKNYQYLYTENGKIAEDDTPYVIKEKEDAHVAGLSNWNRPHERAYGAATTLYERHPVTLEKAGEPIADAFAICARENSAIMVMADGVNWGERSCLAARCAVHGCVDYLNKTLFDENVIYTIENTTDVYTALLRSMFAAHNLILQEDGFQTTLCAAFICAMRDSDKFVVCTCNVGDSLAFVYSPKYGVREVTQGSHDIHSMRDMRDALGALGPVDGPDPELNNLTLSMTVVEPGDIVFLTSDGISDNFDPVVGKFAVAKESPRPEEGSAAHRKRSVNGHPDEMTASLVLSLPIVEAYQRHELMLLRMEDLLENGVTVGDMPVDNAQQLCEKLVDFSIKLTMARRRILEDPEVYKDNGFTQVEQRRLRRRLCEKLAPFPGKLDHASVVAYEVGVYQPAAALDDEEEEEEEDEEDVDEEEVEAELTSKLLTPLAQHISAVFREDPRQVVKESFV